MHTALFRPAALLLAATLCGPPRTAAEVALIDAGNPPVGWRFDDGREFPGATGGLAADGTVEAQYRPALRLDGDFSGGGNYVQMGRDLPAVDLEALSFWTKAPQGAEHLTVRLIDGSGQCHQFDLRIEAHGRWQQIVFPVARYFEKVGTTATVELVKRYEGWGGAEDGRWHNPARGFHILASRRLFGEARKGSLWLSRAQLQVAPPRTVKESFDDVNQGPLPEGWQSRGPVGSVGRTAEAPFDGAHALRIQRAETQLNDDVAVTGAAFTAAPGPWRFGGAARSALHSPDNSFVVRLNVESLDGAGAVVERTTLVDQTGAQNWRPFARQIELPKGTVKARFTVTVHKTHGTCDFDALTAVPLAVKREARLVERIVIGSAATGNLFLPEDEVSFTLEVRCERPLPDGERRALATVTDYWGAEQFATQTVALERDGLVQQRLRYRGRMTLPKDTLQVGKYYELHIAIPLTGFEDAAEYSGFARLPVAESRRYPAEQIPFSIRNWDSRIPAYFKLASRIGHRQIGTWGDSGWERIRDQGDKWYGGPAGVHQVEREGWKNITEATLRENAIAFMTKHKDTESLVCIMLGNEPNERPELVAEKVRAYKIAYEALKSVDPDVKIVTTSVPPLEKFFAAGYHRYTDAYNFHVYGTYESVRQQIRRYRELGRKYGAEKPIWSTELGLNSQGQARSAVAREMVKKIASFFAEGGANVSWFTIMYPDPDGRARGTGGNAHNTFDSQYNQYNPRLDAIMYYNMINGITVKKFADEVRHADGVQAYLFADADGNCFQVLWRAGGRVDRGIPLPGVSAVRLIRVDGSDVALQPADGAVTLGISCEPLLLRYRQDGAKLARELSPAALTVPDQPLTILKGQSRPIRVTGPGLRVADLTADVPPRWTVDFRQDGRDTVVCTVTAPAATGARTGRVMLQRKAADGLHGEIILALPLMSPISVDVLAAPRDAAGDPGVLVRLTNNDTAPQPVRWTLELTGQWPIDGGVFRLQSEGSVSAYLKGDAEGRAQLEPGATRALHVRLVESAPQTLYRVRVAVTDDVGRRVTRERFVGGFALAARAVAPPAIDGRLDDAVWSQAPAERVDTAAAAFRFRGGAPWRDAADLAATWRAAWDEQALYLAVEVTDDVHRVQFADAAIWNQDGLQFLFDPTRTLDVKDGKYDYSVGAGTKGPQAWCHLAAHSSVSGGEAKSFRIAVADLPGAAGGKLYEVAIPWASLAPFAPAPGANLGMNLTINEDDGHGRIGFSGWFGGAHSKELDQVGDLVLAH